MKRGLAGLVATLGLAAAACGERSRAERSTVSKPEPVTVTVANTAVPTVAAIVSTGATPKFVDVDPATYLMDTSQLEGAITPRTKCILPVHLFGQCVPMDDVRDVAGPAALQDDWAMTNAIEDGKAAEALRQLGMMLDGGAAPEQVLGQLGWLVRAKFPQAAPQSLSDAVDSLFRTDHDLKRSGGDARVLLERLVVELCAGKRARVGARRW